MEVDKKDIFGYYISIMNEKFLLSSDITYLNNKAAPLSNGCAVAVGSFDGVHLGHRRLISKLVDESKRLGVPSVVFSFDLEDNPKSAPLLADKKQKAYVLRKLGVDIIVSGRFSDFRDIEAEAFALDFLLGELGAKSIICGYDFRFGKDRKGSVELLKELLTQKGVEISVPEVALYGETPISSSMIRSLISEGDVKTATNLLGRYFSFSGEIKRGAQLGGKLGFPTINQDYPDFLVKPKFGVYAVYLKLEGEVYSGVANFGIKPTVGGTTPLCETHIFDYSGDCYGKTAEISFVEFIRPEQKFNSVDELKEQIALDTEKAWSVLFQI